MCIGKEHLVGRCGLNGQWNGSIEVRLSGNLARAATAAMLMLPAETVDPADMLDAVREITNMIAGTVKSALPRPCLMTIPEARIEDDDFCVIPRTPDTMNVFLRHDAGEMLVQVREKLQNSEAMPAGYALETQKSPGATQGSSSP